MRCGEKLRRRRRSAARPACGGGAAVRRVSRPRLPRNDRTDAGRAEARRRVLPAGRSARRAPCAGTARGSALVFATRAGTPLPALRRVHPRRPVPARRHASDAGVPPPPSSSLSAPSGRVGTHRIFGAAPVRRPRRRARPAWRGVEPPDARATPACSRCSTTTPARCSRERRRRRTISWGRARRDRDELRTRPLPSLPSRGGSARARDRCSDGSRTSGRASRRWWITSAAERAGGALQARTWRSAR